MSELKPGAQIMLSRSLNSLSAEVLEIPSDTKLRIKKEFGNGNGTTMVREAIATARSIGMSGLHYKCVPHIDQQDMYRFVYDRLRVGGCIGIFPEGMSRCPFVLWQVLSHLHSPGGSHDRTDLLPLKAGVTIMALGAMANDPTINVKIVPVGLSYFHAHKFRSRAVIEFGSPMEIPPELVKLFRQGGPQKREACAQLLNLIYEGLKTVTVRAPDYDTLMVQ